MKNHNHQHEPTFKSLGRFLKTMRQRLQESLGETSGAVEIEVELLDRFERGTEAPSEDILMLLISHFGLGDDEAAKMWELAGYDPMPRHSDSRYDREYGYADDGQIRQTMHVMLLALDNRVLYSDGAEIVTDKSGVVVNFTQGSSHQASSAIVSRIGMSYDQAEQLLQVLQRALLHRQYLSGPKKLPPPSA